MMMTLLLLLLLLQIFTCPLDKVPEHDDDMMYIYMYNQNSVFQIIYHPVGYHPVGI